MVLRSIATLSVLFFSVFSVLELGFNSAREPVRYVWKRQDELLSDFPDPGSTAKAVREKQYLRKEDEGMHIPPMGGVSIIPRQNEYEKVDTARANENFLQKYIKYGNPVTRKEKGGTNDLISMAIHDMRTQHNKRLAKILNKDMEDAAQVNADAAAKCCGA